MRWRKYLSKKEGNAEKSIPKMNTKKSVTTVGRNREEKRDKPLARLRV